MAKFTSNEPTQDELKRRGPIEDPVVEEDETIPNGKLTIDVEEDEAVRPEKFKSEAELIKAYLELEKKIGKPVVEEEVKPVVEETTDIDIDAYAEEFLTTGILSAESYTALAAKGFSTSVVNNVMEGYKARQDAATSKIYEVAGGKEALDEAFKWVKTGWSPGAINAFNDIMGQNDMAKAEFAVKALMTEFRSATGVKGKTLQGKAPYMGSSTDVYESQRQWLNDIQDPAYKKDQAFRDKVNLKLSRSNI